MSDAKTKMVKFRLTPEDLARLDALAEAKGTGRSEVLRALIADAEYGCRYCWDRGGVE